MKLYAPAYYKNFTCIADKCEHSCCIGWEIDIDAETLKKYEGLNDGYGSVIKSSISYDGDPHFSLCEGDRCPHLNENGLCKIILGVSEDHLCTICREHPRFYNFTRVAEVGIGMSCREAARVILSSPLYHISEEVGEMDADEIEIQFDGRLERERLYKILRDNDISYIERINKICEEYEIFLADDSVYLKIIENLEYLDPSHKDMLLTYSSERRANGFDEYLERFLAYLIYRHCTEAVDLEDFSARLGFCLILEGLLSSLIHSQNAKDIGEIATLSSIISEEIEYSDDNTETLIFSL